MEDDTHQHEEEERAEIENAFFAAMRKIQDHLPSERTRPFERPLRSFDHIDFGPILAERRRHETPHEARCVRIRRTNTSGALLSAEPDSEDPSETNPATRTPSQWCQLDREMQGLIREQQVKALTSGVDRQIRWKVGAVPPVKPALAPAPSTTGQLAGNSLNAALSRGGQASNVSLLCQCLFGAGPDTDSLNF